MVSNPPDEREALLHEVDLLIEALRFDQCDVRVSETRLQVAQALIRLVAALRLMEREQ
jgi:hypothetical protein